MDRLVGVLPEPLRRLAFRLAYRVLRAWWFVFRPTKRGVKCVLTRGGDHVLLVRHTYGGDFWELPGGGVKRSEEPIAAARREIHEELGLALDDWRFVGELFARIEYKNDRLWCFAAEAGERPIVADRAEIAEERWFSRNALPDGLARHVDRIVGMAAAGPKLQQ